MVDFLWLRFLYDDWINDDDKLVDDDDDTVADNVDDEDDIWLFCNTAMVMMLRQVWANSADPD